MRDERPCASCGEPVEPRQLVCLNCGARVALKEHRSWANEPMAPLAASLVVLIVIGAGLFGFAISELTSGDGSDEPAPVAAATETAAEGPSVVTGEEQQTRTQPYDELTRETEPKPEPTEPTPTETTPTETAPTETAEATPPSTDPNAIPRWPADLAAHTVVLVTTGDRPAAENVAREARGVGLEAGILRSDPYNLGTNLWIVYTGQFDTKNAAAKQAAGLQERYPGAYPQLVQRSQ